MATRAWSAHAVSDPISRVGCEQARRKKGDV